MSTNPKNATCPECGVILRQMRDAWRADYQDMRERVRAAWRASGLELGQFYAAYLSFAMDSLDTDSEGRGRFHPEFPRFAEMRRRASEHELLTGHSVGLDGWRVSGIGGDLAAWFG